MRKIKLFSLCMLALSFAFVGCKSDDGPDIDLDNIVEDGFYVVGEASAVANLQAEGANKAIMAVGINENNDQTVRDGMYEKYIALKGGKPFSLVLKEGNVETKYGATLGKVNLANEEGGQVNDQPTIEIYQGAMTENSTMQVDKDGLYHIVLDLNKDNKLSDKLIVIAEVEWGVAGAMNGWGFDALEKPTFNLETMTYTLENVTVESAGGFKFKYGNGWKIQLNTLADETDASDPRYVKANTNLGNNAEEQVALKGNDLKPGGKDIDIARGIYTVTLKWSLAQGDIKNSYVATLEKTGELEAVNFDPEAITYSFIGNAIYDGTTITDWNYDADFTYVGKTGDVYSYEINNITLAAGEFKVRVNHDWGKSFGFNDLKIEGISDLTEAGGNLKIDTETAFSKITFSFKFEEDQEAEKTLTFVK